MRRDDRRPPARGGAETRAPPGSWLRRRSHCGRWRADSAQPRDAVAIAGPAGGPRRAAIRPIWLPTDTARKLAASPYRQANWVQALQSPQPDWSRRLRYPTRQRRRPGRRSGLLRRAASPDVSRHEQVHRHRSKPRRRAAIRDRSAITQSPWPAYGRGTDRGPGRARSPAGSPEPRQLLARADLPRPGETHAPHKTDAVAPDAVAHRRPEGQRYRVVL